MRPAFSRGRVGLLDDYVYNNVRGALAWAPEWVSGLAILLIAALAAMLLHRTVLRLIRRMFKPGNEFVPRVINRTHGPSRMALVIVFVALALRPADLPPPTTALISHGLLVGFIVLAGWIADTAADVGAGIYLRRFRVDVEDNLLARKHVTQIRVLKRAAQILIVVVTAAVALTTFTSIREYGVSLLASAGAAGIVLGFAAKPVLANLIAGIQLAVTQPIRIDDAVVVEGEWGWIEEITATYVVIRLWDWRRLVVPLAYFMENPFQNWTRETAHIIGTVFLYVDYTAPVEAIRGKVEELARSSRHWDGQVVNVQVTDAGQETMEVRVLVSGRNSPTTWDLRCEVREKIIAWLQEEYPGALPRRRAEMHGHLGLQPQGTEMAGRSRNGGEWRPPPATPPRTAQ